jgi:hypothetical protein
MLGLISCLKKRVFIILEEKAERLLRELCASALQILRPSGTNWSRNSR